MDDSLAAILDVSPYNDEDALKEELRILRRKPKHRGTSIVLFNLKRNKAGQLELDFVSDPEDIRNPPTHEREQTSSQEQDTGLKFRESLRAYCSILYLAPKLTINIRGKKVKTQSLKGKLKSPGTYSYKPKKSGKGTDITFGYRRRGAEEMLEDYGIMFYHRNRLIEPYVKLKSQPPTSSSHEREISGVIDVGEVLETTHTKQAFQTNTTQYRSMMRALDEKLKEYLGRTSQSDEEEEEPTAGNSPEQTGNRRGRSRNKTSDGSTPRRSTAESVDEDEQGTSSTSGVTSPSTSTATKRTSATPRPPSSKRSRTATRSSSHEPAVAEPGAQVSPSQPQPRTIPVRQHTRTIGATTGPEEPSLEKVVARATKRIAKSVFKNTARSGSSPGAKSNTAASTSRSGNATVEGTQSDATASTSQAAGNTGNAAASTSRSRNASVESTHSGATASTSQEVGNTGYAAASTSRSRNASVESTHSGATASTSQAAGNTGKAAASTSRSRNATVEGTHSGATASTSQTAGNSSDTSSRRTSSGATSSSNPQAATSNTNSTRIRASESANSSNVCNTGDSAGHEQAQRQLRKFKESVFKLLGLIIPYVNLRDLPGHGSEEEIETTVENMIKHIERTQT